MSEAEKKDEAMAKDGRRRHPHWQVTLIYADKEVFGRVYTDLRKAKGFAARQRKSPMVKAARIKRVS